MLRLLFRDSITYGFANGIQKLVPFFIIPIITHFLGQEALKLYDVSFVYAYLFAWLITCGQDAASYVFYFDKEYANRKKQVTSYAFLVQFILLIVFFLLFIPLQGWMGKLMFSNDLVLARYWSKAVLVIPGFMFLNYSLNLLLWQKKKGAYLFLCLLQTALSLGAVGFNVVWMKGGTNQLFYSLIGAADLAGLAGLFLVRHHIFAKLQPVPGLLRKLLLFGIPFGIITFFNQLLPSIDRYFLLYFQKNDVLPQYILAVKLGGFMSLGVTAFGLAFTPYSLSVLNEKDGEEKLSRLFRSVFFLAFAAIPVLLVFKDLMVQFFGDPTYVITDQLLPFFFFGWAFDLFVNFSLLGVYRSKRSFTLLLLYAGATVFISVLNLFLIPVIGLYGAALSFCVVKGIMFLAPLYFMRTHFRLKVLPVEFLSVLALTATLSWLVYILPVGLYLSLLLAVLVAGFFYVRKNHQGFPGKAGRVVS